MEAEQVIQGRRLGPEDSALVRHWLATEPGWNRMRLSRELCGRWNWRNEAGRLKDTLRSTDWPGASTPGGFSRSAQGPLGKKKYLSLLTQWLHLHEHGWVHSSERRRCPPANRTAESRQVVNVLRDSPRRPQRVYPYRGLLDGADLCTAIPSRPARRRATAWQM